MVLRRRLSKSVVLKTQGIIIGDFLIIPTIVYMITYFYQTVEDPLPETVFPAWTSITCLISLILVLISAIRFKLVNRWFFPHLIFYWFIAYILLAFLTKGIYQLIFGEAPPLLWAVWTFVLMGIVTHVIFGVKKTCLQATRDFR